MANADTARPAVSWVPVEHRWLGLDRRSFGPAIVVAVIGLLLAGVLPLINQAVPGDDEIKAGDRLNLGAGITMAAPAGWQLEQGVRVGATTTVPVTPGTGDAVLVRDGVSVTVHLAPFGGDAGALLDQVDENESRSSARPDFSAGGQRSTVTAVGGIVGLTEKYTGASTEGAVAAYTFAPDGIGMTISASAPTGQFARHAAEVTAIQRSVMREEPA